MKEISNSQPKKKKTKTSLMSLKILYLYYGGNVWVQCLRFYLFILCVFMCLKPNILLQQCHSWILNHPLIVEPQSTKPSIKLAVIVNARNQRLDLNLMGKKKKKNQNLNVEFELDIFSSIFFFLQKRSYRSKL